MNYKGWTIYGVGITPGAYIIANRMTGILNHLIMPRYFDRVLDYAYIFDDNWNNPLRLYTCTNDIKNNIYEAIDKVELINILK